MPVRIELDKYILADVLGLMPVRQIKIRHAQHIIRILRVQRLKLHSPMLCAHAFIQCFPFLPLTNINE